jgi:hypothetical protein
MSETLSIEQYNALRAALPSATKIKTRLAKKPAPDTLTAGQFRHDHVDQDESPLQQRCVTWFRWVYPQLLLFAVPNGGSRSKAEAGILIGEGVLAGTPDLVLAYPCQGKSALFIEMKCMRKGSKPSDDQLTIHAYLRSVGYEVAIPATFEQFQAAITDYLNQ